MGACPLPCSPGLQKASEGGLRIDPARLDPGDELRDINAAIGGLAVVDPTLRLPETFAQVALRQLSFVPEGAQKPRQALVEQGLLSLGRHLTRLSGQSCLTRVACQRAM